MPTENYSHIVMDNKHMVDGDGVGDDDGEESLEIPFSGVENWINQPPKMNICMVAVLWFAKRLHPPGIIGILGIYKDLH
jgi:hypothetical protein